MVGLLKSVYEEEASVGKVSNAGPFKFSLLAWMSLATHTHFSTILGICKIYYLWVLTEFTTCECLLGLLCLSAHCVYSVWVHVGFSVCLVWVHVGSVIL